MKKILLVLFLFFSLNTAQASIVVEYNDGIYHAILSGKKMYKKINFISSSDLTPIFSMV